nr:MAG TPA: KTSC domain [Caudoviricetes sp.]
MENINELNHIATYLVESSNIRSFGYSILKKALIIEFKDLSKYAYLDVPKEIVTNFIDSDSKGKFLYKFIRPSYTALKLK